MGCRHSKEMTSKQSTDVSTTMTTSSSAIQSHKHNVQDILLVWVDTNIDESKKDYQNALAQFRSVINDVKIIKTPGECLRFLREINNEKVFVITSGSLGEQLVPNIHTLPQLYAIYIFCSNRARHESWARNWNKIRGIHTDLKHICEALQQTVKQYDQDSIAVSFVTTSEGASSKNLNQLEPAFMYTHIFKEILLKMEYDEKSIKILTDYCSEFYNNNTIELKVIDEFQHSYKAKSPIWWYTRECFTYKMLNRALRTLEGDTIINMGFFIRDLHEQIEQLYQKQIQDYNGQSFMVYRGQGLANTDFQKLQRTKGGLMSFNSFLSTSTERTVSFEFAEKTLIEENMVGILFQITIDPSVSSTPFAYIPGYSFFQKEGEILFSMLTIFRVGEITEINKNSLLYQVDLRLTEDNDEELRILTKRIQEEVGYGTGWARLGMLLIKLNQLDKAEELYNMLLNQTSDLNEKATYYNNLGYIKNTQADYKKAAEYYERAVEIEEKILPANHPLLATSYNNIGTAYDCMKEHSKALSFYEKDLEICQKTIPVNHHDLAVSYNNIGEVHKSMGEYSEALSFCERAVEICQKSLPANHPLLATSYNNIGSVYSKKEEYSKALAFYEKDLEICQKALPANHPDLGISYNNIAGVYDKLKERSKALKFYEDALRIFRTSLPLNHPDVETVEKNIEQLKKTL